MRIAVEKDPLNAVFRYDLSNILCGRAMIGVTKGMKIEEADAAKIKNDEAKHQAGLAMELDPDNERFHEWFDRFE